MAEDVLKYADYFPIGMRVEVELPLAEGNLLREDARIVFAHRDLLELQLSRYIISESVILEIGNDLFLRTGKKGKGYRCRALFLRCDSQSRFHVRLTGEIIPLNEREFFRIDVFIPLLYRPYSEHGRGGMREGGLNSPSEGAQSGENRAGMGADLKRPFPVAANLSGAGVRINIPERFEIDELLELTLYLPFGDASTMTLVGQVVHVIELSRAGDPHPLFGTALHFVSLDDSHRETLIRFIQKVQLKQLRRLREQSLLQVRQAVEAEVEPLFSRRRVLMIFWAILLALLFANIVLTLDNYRRNRNKGEIERTFEKQIRKIIERR